MPSEAIGVKAFTVLRYYSRDKIAGGYVVRDARGRALVYVYSRDRPRCGRRSADGRRGAADRHQHREAAGATWEGGSRLKGEAVATVSTDQTSWRPAILASLRPQRSILRGGSEHRTRQAPTR